LCVAARLPVTTSRYGVVSCSGVLLGQNVSMYICKPSFSHFQGRFSTKHVRHKSKRTLTPELMTPGAQKYTAASREVATVCVALSVPRLGGRLSFPLALCRRRLRLSGAHRYRNDAGIGPSAMNRGRSPSACAPLLWPLRSSRATADLHSSRHHTHSQSDALSH
jgi:hypothetical protein